MGNSRVIIVKDVFKMFLNIRGSTTAGGNTVAVTWSACAQDAFVMAALHACGNVAALELM